MDEDLFQNNQEFKLLSKFMNRITKGNQKVDNLQLDDIFKLRSLVDQAISKLKKIYNNPQHSNLSASSNNDNDDENESQKYTVSVFCLISQSLYILSRYLTNRKYSTDSEDELIVNLHSQNERLQKENRKLRSKINQSLLMHSNDMPNNEQEIPQPAETFKGSSNDDADDMIQYMNDFSDGQNENFNNDYVIRICKKLKINKLPKNEEDLIHILQIEINKSKKIKQEIIRHYKLNFDDQNYVSLSNIVQALDKHIKKEIETHADLRGELFEATESLGQLKNELEYITKSVMKKDDKISQLRSERNEARQQLNELLQTIKQSNYNTSPNFNDQEHSEDEFNNKDIEIQELQEQLQKAQNSIRKKKQKIEKMKQRIESLEAKELDKQATIISNLANSMDNFEASLNKSQSKIESRSFSNNLSHTDPISEDNLYDMKKELINLKSMITSKDEQITNLKSFVTDIASQYENASNELSEESKNKFELARCVQLLLDANQILEKLLETSNQQKEELKNQLENSMFKTQNTAATAASTVAIDNNNNSLNDIDMNECTIMNDQLLLQKMKKMTDEIFQDNENSDENQISSNINKIISNDYPSTEPKSNSVLQIYKLILDFIISQKKKLTEISKDLNEEKSFSSHLYSACLGQLRFIMDLSDSRMMQNWIFGNENEEWVRQSLQNQAARMESFFDNFIESYKENQIRKEGVLIQINETDTKSKLNPIQKIEKGIFEELLPVSKSTDDHSKSDTNSANNSNTDNHVEHALLIPLSTRIREFLENYKEKLSNDQMSGENKDLYLMLVQSIAANNVLQVLATEEGNQCKSQIKEIRNLQNQLSMLSKNNYPSQNPSNNEASPNSNTDRVDFDDQEISINNEADDEDNNEENEIEIDLMDNNNKKKRRKKNSENEMIMSNQNQVELESVYKEINNIKKILRKTVSKIITNKSKKPEKEGENRNPYSELYVCLKCIEKAEKVTKFDKDKYIKKLEKYLLQIESSIKDEMVFLQKEYQSRINQQEATVKKLNQQLSSRENELKVLKESIMMLNFGETSVIDELHKQNNRSVEINDNGSYKSSSVNNNNDDQISTENNNNEEEAENEEIKNQRQLYEEMANKLEEEVEALRQQMAKMSKAQKNQPKLLSTINFLTNQKKEIEEEQQKERETYQKSLEQLQAENSSLVQKLNEFKDNLSNIKDKMTKIQIENKLLKSRLKNEEEKNDREKSLIESRMKLKAFSIENTMKDKIGEAIKQQQDKQKELVVYIYNLFSGEVELLLKNEEIEIETNDKLYSFLQAVKTKMSRLERSSYACDSALNELNEIRSTIESFISDNRNSLDSPLFENLEINSKCSRIIRELLDSFSKKAIKLQKQENELKQLEMDSLNASKLIEKAKDAIEWENWSRRIQRFITDGFDNKPINISPPAPISPSQVLVQKSNSNANLVLRVQSSKDVRNKLEDQIYSLVNGNIKKLLRKIEILRTEKSILNAAHLNHHAQQVIFAAPSGKQQLQRQANRYGYRDDQRFSNVSMHHLIIIAVIAKRVEKLSGHVPSFVMKRNFDSNVNESSQNANSNPVKPIFSQFISPL